MLAARVLFFAPSWASAPGWVNVLLVSAATLSALGVLFKFIWAKVLKPAVKVSEVVPPLTRLAEVAPQLQAVATIANTLEAISLQFVNNGGSSLRDSVDRIETRLVERGDQMTRIEATVAGHTVAIERLARAAQRQITHAEETRAEMASLAPEE